jgi:hypothetical protein
MQVPIVGDSWPVERQARRILRPNNLDTTLPANDRAEEEGGLRAGTTSRHGNGRGTATATVGRVLALHDLPSAQTEAALPWMRRDERGDGILLDE